MEEKTTPTFSKATRVFLTAVAFFAIGFLLASVFPPSFGVAGMSIAKSVRTLGSADSAFDQDVPLDRVREAYNDIAQRYYWFSTVDKQSVVNGMIKGMVDSLGDPHSEFLDDDAIKNLNDAIDGNFEGIGAYVAKTDSGVLIKQVIDGTPAKDGGLLPGDIIEKADGVTLVGLDIEDAIGKIRGPAGSSVMLSVLRPSEKGKVFEKSIVRREVKLPSVTASMMTGSKIGLISVNIFGETTPQEFRDAYRSLSNSGMDSLVLDLRDNPGGLLTTAVSLLSNFVEDGKLVVETRGNTPDLTQKYDAEGGQQKPIPLVVLVNGNSASAAEITAGALKDYGLGVLVGEKTYGKWSVQEPIPLSDGSELKLTIARWYTPSGKGIDKIGIEPDVPVDLLPEDFANGFDRQLDMAKQILNYEMTGKTPSQSIGHFASASGTTSTGATR